MASRSTSSGGAFDAGFEHQETQRDLTLERVGDADHGAFRDIGMRRQHLLDLAGREAVGGDIDDVVGAGHHVDIAVGVDEPGIGRLIKAWERFHIRVDEAVIGLPQGQQRPRRQAAT